MMEQAVGSQDCELNNAEFALYANHQSRGVGDWIAQQRQKILSIGLSQIMRAEVE